MSNSSKSGRVLARAVRQVVEQLEGRRLLAAVAINGTSGVDTIVFNGSTYTLNGTAKTLPAGTTAVSIDGKAGNDKITINKTVANVPLTVTGNGGVDTITYGDGNLNNIKSNVTVNGSGPDDASPLNGDAIIINDANAPTISSEIQQAFNSFYSQGFDTFTHNQNSFNLTYYNFNNVTATFGGSKDVVQVNSTGYGMKFTVNSGGGDDFWEVGSGDTGGRLSGIRSPVQLNAGTGTDHISLNNEQDDTDNAWVMTASKLTDNNSVLNIGFSGFENFDANFSNLGGTPLNQTVDATAGPAGVTWNLGDGTNLFYGSAFADVVETGTGVNELHGGGGNDRLTTAGETNNKLFGDAGNDSLFGGTGDNSFEGGSGNDKLVGSTGRDLYFFANAPTTAETDTIEDSNNYTNPQNNKNTLYFVGLGSTTFSNQSVNVNLLSNTLATQGARTIKTAVANSFPSIRFVYGGSGNDKISGNALNNALIGGAGNDTLLGLGGFDDLIGEGGNDSLDGGDGDDNLSGDDGNATTDGNDTLIGGKGNDNLTGNGGNDTYFFADSTAAETDLLFESDAGQNDTLDFSTVTGELAVSMDADGLNNIVIMPKRLINNGDSRHSKIEKVIGGTAADAIDATFITTGATIIGGKGDDVLVGSTGNDSIDGGDGNDTVVGDQGNDLLLGGAGNDSLDGGLNNDTIDGGEGSDTMYGGLNNDTYKFANATAAQTDTLRENTGEGTDLLDFTPVTTALTVNLTSNTLATHTNRTIKTAVAGQFANFENVVGGTGADKITGNAAANILAGGAGNDTLFGGANNDRLEGNAGNDQLTGDAGLDYLLGGSENDKLFGLDGSKDTLDGGTGTDTLGSGDSIDIKTSIP